MILPGTYIEVRAEGLIAPGQVTVGNLGVVGTAAKGPVNVPVLVGTFADAKQVFFGYDPWIDGNSNELTLVRALEQAFNHGATTVFAVRVAGGSEAAASRLLKSTTGDCVTLAAKSPGTWGNSLAVTIGPAEENPLISDEEHLGSAPAPLTLRNIPTVKSARNRVFLHIDATNVTKPLKILYAPDDAAAPQAGEVTINKATGVMTFGDLIGANDKITVSYLVDKSKGVLVTFFLDTAKESYTVVSGSDLLAKITDPETASAWVTGTAAANAIELPLKSTPPDSKASFAGGDDGAAAGADDYQAGLATLENEPAHIMVAAGQTDVSFGAKLDQHCQRTSTDSIKRDRIGVIGSRLTATVDDLRGHNLDSDRIIFVAPGIKATDVTGDDVILPGAYTAAAVAGRLAALPAHLSPTNKVLPVDDLQKYYTSAELEQLVQARVLAVERRAGFRIVKGITTSSGSAFSQITTRRIVDYAKFGVRSAADPFIGLLNNERVRTALRASINAFLVQMMKDEMLVFYEVDVSATRDEQKQGIARVTMTLQPVFSIDFIKVTMFLE
jgi:hypothetical protein